MQGWPAPGLVLLPSGRLGGQELQRPRVVDWLALELLSGRAVLLCVQQLQLPRVLDWLQLLWVLDWLALELLFLLPVLLCVQQPQLPWVLDWLVLELLACGCQTLQQNRLRAQEIHSAAGIQN